MIPNYGNIPHNAAYDMASDTLINGMEYIDVDARKNKADSTNGTHKQNWYGETRMTTISYVLVVIPFWYLASQRRSNNRYAISEE